jgi:hypothetical protein
VVHFSIMRKYLLILFALILGLSVYVSVQDERSLQQSGEKPAQSDNSVSNNPPNGITNSKGNQPFWFRFVRWPEGVGAWAIILTLFVIGEQTRETAKAAKATEASVEAGKDTAKRQLRAYVTVIIGDAVFQERRDEDKGGDLMFECRPLLVNNGQTPARKIRFKARAAILPVPLPKEIHLPEEPDEGIGDSILGPQQNANMFALVDGFRADDEAESLKKGVGAKGLYVWGRITYEDVFGESHFTRFCQHIYWNRGGKVRGHYIPGRNDAD